MQVEILNSLAEVDPRQWNALTDGRNPFVSHEFLVALECQGCLGSGTGWYPRHFVIRDKGRLLGGLPAYLKTNSFGEFVFDWSWADAYQRAGLQYYPKLVVAIPYTPATGPRLLVAPNQRSAEIAEQLHLASLEYAREQGLSSLHWLFTPDSETAFLERQGLMRRMGCQYHWTNQDYGDFDDFLSHLKARKRKKVNRERRRPGEQGVSLSLKHGTELDEQELNLVHHYYSSIYDRKFGTPTLTRGFFHQVSKTMGDRMLVVFAYHRGKAVAASILFRGTDTLYGRFWGCREQFHSLHFEACYYQGIDYCIAHGIRNFEPGAQGEHKISRGFLPRATWSTHWIAHKGFRDAIHRYLNDETQHMEFQCEELRQLSPFRETTKAG